jgi:hypothetical protein
MSARTVLVAVALLLGAACDDRSDIEGQSDGGASSGDSNAAAADEFPARYAVMVCALATRCCEETGVNLVEDCEEDVAFQQGLDAAYARASGARFDSEAAEACLMELARRRCDADPLNLLGGYFPGCSSVWIGQVPLGGACKADLDCSTEEDASLSCLDGTCQRLEQLLPGSDCDPESRTAVCASGFSTCDAESMTCVPLPSDGQACISDCRLGYHCRAGTCHPEAGLPGGACTSPSECQSGTCVGGSCASVLVDKYCVVPE